MSDFQDQLLLESTDISGLYDNSLSPEQHEDKYKQLRQNVCPVSAGCKTVNVRYGLSYLNMKVSIIRIVRDLYIMHNPHKL